MTTFPAIAELYNTPATKRTTRHNTYAIKVRGNQMKDCNLFDGDVIIIRRFQHDTHDETAVAEINRRPVALKHLSISREGVHLQLEQVGTPAIFLHNRNIQVLGLVMGVGHQAS
ncbi:S24 family peptidase [Halomonas vilamensis]|uniref:S24 family peptidase n=1 Tax=Vreelandella vilamensis TaxID=531309 RepID=A0ABU1H4E3_9GAMM|nr:S24 family peptidase [Halomonas vilamensis]MDR5899174.1 S24 family peptidase [Halomonas vilamensis]